MKVRAIVFDVYQTLLDVHPAPTDAATRWDRLWCERLGRPARLDLRGFAAACDAVIAREHTHARAVGIDWPEVYWPAVVREVLPELERLDPVSRDGFLFEQAGLWHTVRLMPGAADALRRLARADVPLGLASNAQPYTLRELDRELAGAGLTSAWFDPALCSWSFQHGFSKPDPRVFRILAFRLRARDIRPGEILMVGDRPDNDIAPASAQGWQTWHLTPERPTGPGGDWAALLEWLRDGRSA